MPERLPVRSHRVHWYARPAKLLSAGVAAVALAVTVAVPASARTTSTQAGSSAVACPASGHITYTLQRAASPTAAQTDAYNRITSAMDAGLTVYNCYTAITKSLNVVYDPSVATADGNWNGTIRFGSTGSMVQATAMHETAHTLGVGTYGSWSSFISNGQWTGTNAINQLRPLTGDSSAVLYAGGVHFWPYGLNYASEVTSNNDYIWHCKIVVAIRKDMGIS